jgi:Ricin-type beta-trefoil lectin domain
VIAAVLGLLALAPAPAATATPREPAPGSRLPADERWVCPLSTQPGVMSCQSVVRIPSPAQRAAAERAARAAHASGPVVFGYGPVTLRRAYGLLAASARNGRGETVAIVDAHSNPHLASDLAVYRRHYRLPACTMANGCLRIINQYGAPRPLPTPSAAWGLEESLDLDVVSAICPLCRIVLVEARESTIANLARAEVTAAATGARFISNSWSGPEFPVDIAFDQDFDHPGDAVTVSAGDYGYAALYPATNQFVTAVGGTSLIRDKATRRGWKEHAWGTAGVGDRFGNPYAAGTGSGCSTFEPKPSWQRAKVDDTPAGCLNRTVADVAADADPATGPAMYDSYATAPQGGPWIQIGGTSVSAPIIAATYALAGPPAAGTYPASYPYRDPSGLFDVTYGVNGDCEPARQYLCHAEPGYDGPTGLGTPDGIGAFSDHGARPVTLVDPGPQDAAAGGPFSLRITGLDASPHHVPLSYAATGLPPGLSIRAVAGTTEAVISGTLPAMPSTWPVTVTARDTVSRQDGSVRFMIVGVGSLSQPAAHAGRVSLHDGKLCLDAAAGSGGPAAAVLVEHCTTAAGEAWVYASGATPGGPGTLAAGGSCLTRTGAGITLAGCEAGNADQQWTLAGWGLLRSGLGGCLGVRRMSAGEHPGVAACSRIAVMRWTLPAGLLVSGTGECADSQGGIAGLGTTVTAEPCSAAVSQQRLALHADLSIQGGSDCLDVPGPELLGSPFDGVAVMPNFCVEKLELSQQWLAGPGGELVNNFSGKCLDDPGPGSGTALVQEDCYGEAGEIWAVN